MRCESNTSTNCSELLNLLENQCGFHFYEKVMVAISYHPQEMIQFLQFITLKNVKRKEKWKEPYVTFPPDGQLVPCGLVRSIGLCVGTCAYVLFEPFASKA